MCWGGQVIRGTAAAPLSQLLTSLEPKLRSAAGLSAWQVISPAQGTAVGRLETAQQLRDVQHSRYPQPTILLVDRVGGDEEIPEVGRILLTMVALYGSVECKPSQKCVRKGGAMAEQMVSAH